MPTPPLTRRRLLQLAGASAAGGLGAGLLAGRSNDPAAPAPAPAPPGAAPRLEAADHGVVLRHGDGPASSDVYGARDALVFAAGGAWHMHYDGAGMDGWRLCLATSPDGLEWTKRGPVLALGPPGSPDAASAAYGVPYADDAGRWHLFYVGAANATAPPERVPAVPYLTLKAEAPGPGGPWTKRPDIVPFTPQPGTYYASSASPGAIVRPGPEFLQFFSAAAGEPLQRTLGIARTTNLDAPWALDPAPILPATEQVENSALYFEPANDTWFLFTNHVLAGSHYTDAIWVYWTQDLGAWDPARRATVLDGKNCGWSKRIVGLPSVQVIGSRLALYYDGVAGGGASHTSRDVGLAWLPLPLTPPGRA